jgi:hypothetical protein
MQSGNAFSRGDGEEESGRPTAATQPRPIHHHAGLR